MYGVGGERRLTEVELDWLPGYENSKPVRIGNEASEQFQLDVFGEIADAALTAVEAGLAVDEHLPAHHPQSGELLAGDDGAPRAGRGSCPTTASGRSAARSGTSRSRR